MAFLVDVENARLRQANGVWRYAVAVLLDRCQDVDVGGPVELRLTGRAVVVAALELG